jgi:hypothetical protein
MTAPKDVALVEQRHAPAAMGRVVPVAAQVDLVITPDCTNGTIFQVPWPAPTWKLTVICFEMIDGDAHDADVGRLDDAVDAPAVLLQRPDRAHAGLRALRRVPDRAAAVVVGVPDDHHVAGGAEDLEAVAGALRGPTNAPGGRGALLDAGGGGEEGGEKVAKSRTRRFACMVPPWGAALAGMRHCPI